MFDLPITIPDQISTLELSKIWLYKACQNLNSELEPTLEQEDQSEDSSNEGEGDRD